MSTKQSNTSSLDIVTMFSTRMTDLPDDVILRILSHVGTVDEQIAVGYKLASLCTRFRHLHRNHFLSSITSVCSTTLNALCLRWPTEVITALTSFFSCTVHLRQLKLAGCSSLLSPQCFSAIARASATSLTEVNLAHCHLSDACLAPLLKCSSLKKLELVSCHGLNGTVFHPNICSAPLRVLDVSWVQSLSSEGIRCIATLKTIQELALTGCEILCSRSLRILASSQIRLSLTKISLSCCPVRDEALFDFVQGTPNIKTIVLAQFSANLWPTGDFTAAGLNRLRLLYPKLTIQLEM